jgi:large subunit ribosomal protein L10
MTYEPHITEDKRKEVEDVKRLFKEYSVSGVVNLEGLPTLMLQRIKKGLSDKIDLKITKKRFMKIAIDELGNEVKEVKQLKEKLVGIPALFFTNEDPFLIYKQIDKNKASAAAKPGQKAPNDLNIAEGETPFTPGPMIGELGMLGIKTEVKNGKVHVKDEKVLVTEGEEISEKVANLLAKLGVEPMKVGLNLTCTLQNGELLDKSVLSIDEEEYLNNIKTAHTESFALAMHLGIINSETVKPLISKAQRESLGLADKANIMTSENVGKMLAKAESEAGALNEKVPDAPAEEPKPVQEAPTQEVKQEAPTEEAPTEEAKPEEAKPEAPTQEVKPEEPKPEVPEPEEAKPEVSTQEPEAPKEEPTEEPAQEVKQEVPTEEAKPEVSTQEPEAPKEEPAEQPTQEVKPEEPKQEAPTEEPKPEELKEANEATAQEVQQQEQNMEQITDITNKILGSGIKKSPSAAPSIPQKSEEDINKLINTLKDKKSKGEI